MKIAIKKIGQKNTTVFFRNIDVVVS